MSKPKKKKKPDTVAELKIDIKTLVEERRILVGFLRETRINFQRPEVNIQVPLGLVPLFDDMAHRVNKTLQIYDKMGV